MVSMLYHVYPTVVLLLISSFQDTTATDHICFRRLNIFNALLYYIMLYYEIVVLLYTVELQLSENFV